MIDFNSERRAFYLSGIKELLIESKESLCLEESSRLIESVLMGIPLPIIYCDTVLKDNEWKRKVLTHYDKINSIKDFMDGNYNLTNLIFFPELEGANWNNLSRTIQRKIEETYLDCYIIDPGGINKEQVISFLSNI